MMIPCKRCIGMMIPCKSCIGMMIPCKKCIGMMIPCKRCISMTYFSLNWHCKIFFIIISLFINPCVIFIGFHLTTLLHLSSNLDTRMRLAAIPRGFSRKIFVTTVSVIFCSLIFKREIFLSMILKSYVRIFSA